MVEAKGVGTEEIIQIVKNSSLNMNVYERMTASKYGMLEIFRAAFNRVDAVLMMRMLSKKFLAYSTDSYLENFYDVQDTMHLEVRKGPDLEYFRKMARYANVIKGHNCLDINFFWNF